MPNIGRILNKSDSVDCFCGTIWILFFFYKHQFLIQTASVQLIACAWEKIIGAKVNTLHLLLIFKDDWSWHSVGKTVLALVCKKKRLFELSHKNSQMNLICSKFSQFLAHNYPQWYHCQKFILFSKRSVCFASLEKK